MSDAPEMIAVVGMGCRFPGANTPDELWANLRNGVESITFRENDSDDPRFVAAKGMLDQADGFDAGFFGVSPREAALMDPQQRVFLETAWSALEDAGYDSRNYAGRIGVFAGSILSVYLVRNLWPNRDLVTGAGNFQIAVGNDPTFLATSTSYQLDLRGPSVSVGTACSTSLVAVHLACQSLLAYESDMAMAGGVSVHLPLEGGYRYEDGGVLSPDGHCRPFDAAAQGTVSSDGAGVVVLKRLSDALADGDTIHAVIRGSAINNDGRLKVGYTAPSGPGEAQVIAEAMAMAGVSPESISLIETHGAGTLLGDPIEVAALTEAFGDCDGKRAFCALGSVKSNIGHVDAAAGIAGLLKTVLSLRHREIPPTLHFQRPNPQIQFDRTPFYVNSDLRPMTRGTTPLRAGVNSFGIGGTNVHVVLEEAPASEESTPSTRPFDLLLLSARTPAALDAATDRLADHLEQLEAEQSPLPAAASPRWGEGQGEGQGLAQGTTPHPNPLPAPRGEGTRASSSLADVAFTLRHGRRAFSQRRIVVAANRGEAIAALRARDPQRVASGAAPASRPTVAFMFPGLGDHYAGMGWELYCTEAAFRESIDRSAELLKPHLGSDIRDFLYSGRDWAHPVLGAVASGGGGLDLRAMLGRKREAPSNDQPVEAQPGIFVTELALAELLRGWGIEPEAMIGHSIGEFSAACISGVLSLPDALEVVATRARLIQSRVGPGAMMAVPLSEAELRPLLPEGVTLGAINGARLCIASGEESGISALSATLANREVSCQRLRSTHAYHSQMMEPLVEPLLAVLQRVTLSAPRIPYVSCITGTWITDAEATDPKYWAGHLCRTVRFHDGLVTLLGDPQRILAEIGPGQGLTSHAIAERRENPVIPTMRWSYGLQSEVSVLLRGVGQLWLCGASLDTSRFLARERQRRVSLPSYPFERQRYWIDPPDEGSIAAAAPQKKRDVADWFYLPSWKPSVRPRSRTEISGNVLVVTDRGTAGLELARVLRARGAAVTTIEPGPDADYETLLRDTKPSTIVHLGALTPNDTTCPSPARFAGLQELGYSSVMRIVQALARAGMDGPVRLEIVANHLLEVTGSELIVPEKATLRAPAMVAPQEHPGLICRVIDTDDSAAILDEIRCEPTDPVVAYRRGMRWIPTYEQVQLQPAAPFRPRGVYLLTGGLGGVGMVLAQHLARTVQARLVLIGRSAPNEEKRARIRELEELGAEVLVIAADVSHHDEMRRALATVDERFGELHGVIHGAGAVGIETFREIREATDADSATQFVAKVRGVMALDEVLADRPLDFVLLMSSLSAILGGLGFSAYSAANLFMDSFARWKNREGGTRWTSVDWDSWRLGDTRPVIAGLGATVNEFVMEPEEGADACERILGEPSLGQVIVSSGDLQSRLRTWIARRDTPATSPGGPTHERPNLSSSYTEPRGELEHDLAAIWQELFGVATIGVHDNFFELGGHSLLATQLNARLSSKLHVEMSLATLLKAPTIAELAIAIVEHQAENTDAETLEQLLAELEDLSLAAGASDE